MKLTKSLFAAVCLTSLSGLSAPMVANAADVGIYLDVAPPAPRHEVVPAPRRGYVWVPGYWNARGHKHVWAAGHWERERVGYHYVQPTWVQHENRWELQRGRWDRGDADHDGVPNGADRAPNNPYRQ
jgi:WXXGXW repeat (2 copies)